MNNNRKSNRLIKEKSPYLLQHAFNPVQWYSWGNDAFTKAKQDNKPIFLSIGYSTCHWCHVMEHESFEDEETAELLNKYFVAIKVDREERPDIDSIYMSFVTATTGSGGWPLSVFLTPDQKPFYGGTYFPPEPRWGTPGFKDVLLSVHNSWQKQEEKVRMSGDSLVKAFAEQLKQKKPSPKIFDTTILDQAYTNLFNNFDTQNGGFGASPKFPMGHNLSFLMRYAKFAKQPEALAMVEKTLSVMSQSGINDQLGGGFHRYSTDAHWQVPHFEKMLYDQALLVKAYLDAFSATGNEKYAKTAAQTLDYVLREMRDSADGFYSAQDADSLEPQTGQKKEGTFYLWSTQELLGLLTPEEMKFLSFCYGIEQQGNALFDPHGEFVGKNVLHLKHDEEKIAQKFNLDNKDVADTLQKIKEKLFAQRSLRPRPHLDDKVLTDWNALMISAFAAAGGLLKEPRYLQAGVRAAEFILKTLRRTDGRLLHRYREAEAGILGGLEDYAFFSAALLDLYEYTSNDFYLDQSVKLVDQMITLFWDEEKGGFYLTAKDIEELVYRPKEVYDGALPSGNSVAALTLLRLYHFKFDRSYLEKAESIFRFFHDDIIQHPQAYCQMMMALDFYYLPSKCEGGVCDFKVKERR